MYYGKKRINYTKYYKYDRWLLPETKREQNEIAAAIVGYLKENLPKIIWDGLGLKQIASDTSIIYNCSGGPGFMKFTDHQVIVGTEKCCFNKKPADRFVRSENYQDVQQYIDQIAIDYADPELFGKLELLVRKFYNDYPTSC